MKTRRHIGYAPLLALTLILMSGAPGGLAAPVPTRLGAESRLWLQGTSTMHDYESGTRDLTLTLDLEPTGAPPADAAGLDALIRSSGVRHVDVAVPVRTLRSKKAGLDKNLWKALRADEHPAIRFRLTRYTAAPARPASDSLAIQAEGTLEVAGASRPITLEAKAWRDASGLWLEGSKPLLMSQFGIKPPTMMMGTLRVADRVVVHFRLLLEPADGRTGSKTAGAQEKGAER